MTLRKKLPSAQSQFAFESVARTLCFTDAGVLLNVTRRAIRKNIAALEAHLGTRLFSGTKAGLAFTSDGDILHRAVHLSFTALEVAIDQISRSAPQKSADTIVVDIIRRPLSYRPNAGVSREFSYLTLNYQLSGGEVSGALGSRSIGHGAQDRCVLFDHILNRPYRCTRGD